MRRNLEASFVGNDETRLFCFPAKGVMLGKRKMELHMIQYFNAERSCTDAKSCDE